MGNSILHWLWRSTREREETAAGGRSRRARRYSLTRERLGWGAERGRSDGWPGGGLGLLPALKVTGCKQQKIAFLLLFFLGNI